VLNERFAQMEKGWQESDRKFAERSKLSERISKPTSSNPRKTGSHRQIISNRKPAPGGNNLPPIEVSFSRVADFENRKCYNAPEILGSHKGAS